MKTNSGISARFGYLGVTWLGTIRVNVKRMMDIAIVFTTAMVNFAGIGKTSYISSVRLGRKLDVGCNFSRY